MKDYQRERIINGCFRFTFRNFAEFLANMTPKSMFLLTNVQKSRSHTNQINLQVSNSPQFALPKNFPAPHFYCAQITNADFRKFSPKSQKAIIRKGAHKMKHNFNKRSMNNFKRDA